MNIQIAAKFPLDFFKNIQIVLLKSSASIGHRGVNVYEGRC